MGAAARARMAFDNGVDVATAVSFRGGVVVVGLLLVLAARCQYS